MSSSSIQTLRHRLAGMLFLKYAILFTACWLFLWGTAALALRSAELLTATQLCWGACGLLIPFLAAWYMVRRSLPSDTTLAALLDRENAAGGLFTASFETDLGAWADRIPQMSVPAVRLQEQRSWIGLLLGGVFLVVALLIPVETLTAKANNRMNIEDRLHKLTRQLDALAEEKILPLEEVEALRVELEMIEKNAEGLSPVKTLDALDHLADQLEQKTAEAIENAEKSAETLAKAESLLQQMEQTLTGRQTSEMKELMQGMAEAMQQAMEENAALKERLADELAQQKKKSETPEEKAAREELQKMLAENRFGDMNAEQLKQLAEAMKKCDGNCERMLENLGEGGCKIDPEALKRLAEARANGKEELDKLIQELREAAGCDGQCESEGMGEKQLSRSPKQDQWDRSAKETKDSKYLESETEEGNAAFRPLILPPPELEALMNAQKIATSVGTPEEEGTLTAGEQGGALQNVSGGTGSAHGHRIHPQHRGTTGRYFERAK